jgi:hypothetical protein
MRCRAARKRLSAYSDGALALYEVVALKDHLSGCAACRRELEAIRRLNRLLSRAPDGAGEVEPAIDWRRFEARLERRLAAQRWSLLRRPWYRQPVLLRAAMGAAATVLLAVAALLAVDTWLRPSLVPSLPGSNPPGGDSTLSFRTPGRSMLTVQDVTPAVETLSAGSGARSPDQPLRLAWLAGVENSPGAENTSVVVLRYGEPGEDAVEHRYTFQPTP